jgi:hypothetical protein
MFESRARNRHVQLNEAHAFTFGSGADPGALAHPITVNDLARVDHATDGAPVSASSSMATAGQPPERKMRSKRRAAAIDDGDSAAGSLAPLDWGLTVSSSTSSTC